MPFSAVKSNEKRLRMTRQRQAILDVLRESHDHPTVAELYQRAKQHMPGLSYATVYNTLSALADYGEVLELPSGGKASRYDVRVNQHDHAVCLRCTKVLDVDPARSDFFEESAAERSGFKILAHHTQFYGYCPGCLREEDYADVAEAVPDVR